MSFITLLRFLKIFSFISNMFSSKIFLWHTLKFLLDNYPSVSSWCCFLVVFSYSYWDLTDILLKSTHFGHYKNVIFSKSSIVANFLWHCHHKGWRTLPHVLPVWLEVQVSPLATTDIYRERKDIHLHLGKRSSGSLLGPCWHQGPDWRRRNVNTVDWRERYVSLLFQCDFHYHSTIVALLLLSSEESSSLFWYYSRVKRVCESRHFIWPLLTP